LQPSALGAIVKRSADPQTLNVSSSINVPKTSHAIQVRSASEADAEAIIQTHFDAVHQTASAFYPAEVLDSWSRRPDESRYLQVRQAIAKGHELFVVAEDGFGVVGFGSIVPTLQELTAVYVHPRRARRGVGAMILEHLERLALTHHCTQLQMDASVNAEAFYRGHGYEVVERGVHRLASGLEMACTRLNKFLLRSIQAVSEEIVLITPTLDLASDFRLLAEEFLADGDERYQEASQNVLAFVRACEDYAAGRDLPHEWVPTSTFWLVRGRERILGCSRLRHRLNRFLAEEGGHIGYDVRPSERGKGYGSLLLALTLGEARNIGFDKVLITADEVNVGSWRVIEKNGGHREQGVFSRESGLFRRYWVATSPV